MARLTSILAAAAAFALAPATNAATVYELTSQISGLTLLSTLIDSANLASTLNSSSINATLFAPVSTGILGLGANIVDYVTNPHNVAALQTILLYHVNTTLPVYSTSLPTGTAVTLNTNDAPYSLSVLKDANGVTINGGPKVTSADNAASNGVVHVIDNVLVPPNFALVPSDIPTLASSVPTFSKLVAALTTANLVSALTTSAGVFTVFAPNDNAFNKLFPNQYQALGLANNLKAHVTSSGKRIYASQVVAASPIATLAGAGFSLVVTTEGPDVYINGISKVLAVDTDANNGVIHTIDTVIATLSIYDLAVDAGLSTLVQLVNAAGIAGVLVDMTTLNALTVFAPTNAAFAALGDNIVSWVSAPHNKAALTKILTYHVAAPAVWSRQLTDGMKITSVEGMNLTITTTGGAKVNGATVTVADVNAFNGAVHVIDQVLVPSDVTIPSSSILTVAAGASNLTSLVAALQSANLTSIFDLPNGPWTVFAPVNTAFDALNAAAVDTAAKLADVLTYHVVSGRYYSDDLSHLSKLNTVEGKNVTVDLYSGNQVQLVSAGGVTANVVVADIDCANGVVHLIDAVLLPQSLAPQGNGAMGANANVAAVAAVTLVSMAAAAVAVAGV